MTVLPILLARVLCLPLNSKTPRNRSRRNETRANRLPLSGDAPVQILRSVPVISTQPE